MENYHILLLPWRVKESPFYSMLHCGRNYCNGWVEKALRYLPADILWDYKDELAFFATTENDACRLPRKLCKEREIILLSERIFPKSTAKEWDIDVKYFIFAVLHEVAHAIRKHPSPRFDNLTCSEKEEQQKEADELAFKWFNDHVKSKKYLEQITRAEIDESREKNQRVMLCRLNR